MVQKIFKQKSLLSAGISTKKKTGVIITMYPLRVEKTRASMMAVISKIDKIFDDEGIPFTHNQKEWDEYKENYIREKERYLRGESTEDIFYNQLQKFRKFFVQTIGMDPEGLFYFEDELGTIPEKAQTTTYTPQEVPPVSQMKFCGTCGSKLRSGLKFCQNCGEPTVAPLPPSLNQPGSVAPPRYSYSHVRKPSEAKGINVGWIVAIFLIPLVGLVVFLGYIFSSRTKAAGQTVVVTILSFVINAILLELLLGSY